jgi:hypothetical protein
MGHRRTVHVLLAGVVAVGVAVRFWGIAFGLPHGQTRPDETYIMDVALAILRGQAPPPHYDYPWLFVWITSAAYLVYYTWGALTGVFQTFSDLGQSWYTHWEPFFLINRGISATFGAATILIVFRFGRSLWDEATGLAAALFVALAYLHARDSHYGTTDVTMTFFIVAAVLLLVRAHACGRMRAFAAAGAVAGLAAATKYNAVVLAVPVVVSWLLYIADSPGRRLQAALEPRLVAFGLPFGLVFAIGVPFVITDFQTYSRAMELLIDSMEAGSPHLTLEPGWVHHFRYSLRYGLGEPLMAAGIGGAVWMAAKDWRRAALVLSFPVAYYLVAGASRNQFFRYVIPTVPFLCLTAAFAVREVTARASAIRPAVRQPLLAGLALAVVAIPAARIVAFDRVMARADNRVVVSRWFAEHVPAGNSILQTGSHYGHAWFDASLRYRLFTWDRGQQTFVVDKTISSELPQWILVQDHPLSSNREVIEDYYLRQGYALAWSFPALTDRDDRIFDLEDAFYVPFAGFRGVDRPGPNFALYQRIDPLNSHEP